jgi:hypothetical protein
MAECGAFGQELDERESGPSARPVGRHPLRGGEYAVAEAGRISAKLQPLGHVEAASVPVVAAGRIVLGVDA